MFRSKDQSRSVLWNTHLSDLQQAVVVLSCRPCRRTEFQLAVDPVEGIDSHLFGALRMNVWGEHEHNPKLVVSPSL